MKICDKGSDDIFLIKLDNTGEKQWIRQIGTSTLDLVFSIHPQNLWVKNSMEMWKTVHSDYGKSIKK